MTLTLVDPPADHDAGIAAILARQPHLADRDLLIRRHRPIPLVRRPAGGWDDVPRPCGWRYVLRLGKRIATADFDLEDPAAPPEKSAIGRIAGWHGRRATRRWLDALVALEEGAAGQDARSYAVAFAADRGLHFDSLLLTAPGRTPIRYGIGPRGALTPLPNDAPPPAVSHAGGSDDDMGG